MYLTEAELESELDYFTECLAVDEEGYPCLYNEATEEYEYIEDEAVFELAEAVLNEGGLLDAHSAIHMLNRGGAGRVMKRAGLRFKRVMKNPEKGVNISANELKAGASKGAGNVGKFVRDSYEKTAHRTIDKGKSVTLKTAKKVSSVWNKGKKRLAAFKKSGKGDMSVADSAKVRAGAMPDPAMYRTGKYAQKA